MGVTVEIIRRYIEYDRDHEKNPQQLKFFWMPSPVGGTSLNETAFINLNSLAC